MTRRFVTRFLAAALTAAVATGCVRQPMDESALELATERLGATPAPLAAAEAERVADEAQTLVRRYVRDVEHRDRGVWTAPRRRRKVADVQGGGLVRVLEPSKDADASSDDGSRDRRPRKREDEPPAAPDDDVVERPRQKPPPSSDRDSTGDGDAPAAKETNSPRPRPPAEPAFRALAGVSDPGDDASGQSPRYADIRQLVIESDGTNARVTVAVAGDIPAALASGEVQGIGIDFFRSNDAESDYQLFVDGGNDGWRAFLHTPDGVVEYPGSFAIGGRVFVLEIPWSSLGGRKAARVNMFVDWSRRRAPINDAGNDRAPERGKVTADPR